MTTDEIRAVVLKALSRIAPEVASADVPADLPLREAVDLDSIDFLNFVVALHQELGVDVPESDYEQLATLGGCVAYLARRTSGAIAGTPATH